MGLLLALGLPLEGTGAHEGTVPTLRTLVEKTDAVIAGVVEEIRPAPGGIWHRVRVRWPLRGTEDESVIELYSHGAGVPESVQLSPGQEVIVGFDWLSRERGSLHRRLLASLEAEDVRTRAGLLAPDAVIELKGSDGASLLAEIRALLERPAEKPRAEDVSRLVELLDSDRVTIRLEALRRLALTPRPLLEARQDAIRDSFAGELNLRGNARVLEAYLDLLRLRDLSGCGETVRELILGRDEAALVSEGIDTLARNGSRDDLHTLLTHYQRANPRSRGRILRTLARMKWEGTVPFCRRALEAGDPGLHVAAVEALGETASEEASRLLSEVGRHGDDELRALALDALGKQGTPASRQILRRALEDARNAGERRRIRRLLSNPRPHPESRNRP